MQKKGVDISEHNGSVDFQALKNAGVQFAIIRLGYGSDYVSQDDSRFSENVRKAETAGMPWGAYLYSYAKTAAMAQSEAQHALRLLGDKKPLYGVWFDVEDTQIAQTDLTATCRTFCDTLEAAGLYAGIYASLSWLTTKLSNAQLDRYDKWVAQWNSSCTYGKAYGIWQYTDKLVIGGKNFDGNYAYKDYPAIVQGMNQPEEEEEEDPRAELVRRLLEYKMYKFMARELEDMEEDAERLLFKAPTIPREVAEYEAPVDLDELLKGLTLAKLQEIFESVIRRGENKKDPVRSGFGTIAREPVSLKKRLAFVLGFARRNRKFSFREMLGGTAGKMETVVTFLAVLELMKVGKIYLTQETVDSDMYIESLEPEGTYEEIDFDVPGTAE